MNQIKQYKMIIAYDGTDFAGWLRQPDRPSIVQVLENRFHSVYRKKIHILGASKTDAGVHALGQVAIFKTDLAIDAEKMRWAWNKALPDSISIVSLEQNEAFHPHYNVKHKTYWYHFSSDKIFPFMARYGAYYRMPFNVALLKQALQLFVGTHDFEQFYTGSDRDNTMRTIQMITLEFVPEYNGYRIVVVGEKFLRHMVRRMVGAALHVAAGRAPLEDIKSALEKSAPSNHLPTAPAKGLLLHSILFHQL